jgi:hypothetical protein
MNIDKNLIKYWSYLCESEEKRYDDFIPDFIPADKELAIMDLNATISAFNLLSRECKKNPDKCLEMLAKNKKVLGDKFEKWHDSLKYLK